MSLTAASVCPGGCSRRSGWGVCHGIEMSHPTMLAVIVDSVAPWRVPQRKKHSTFPNGVEVMMMVPDRDSASHSMYPVSGKPAM